MLILKQSTAVDIIIGPFVDSTNGDSEETGLTIANTDVLISKNGQTMAAKSDVTSCAHDAKGMYNCELDATDTNTVGNIVIFVHVSGALAVRHEAQVVEEAVYVDMFAASAAGYAGISELADVPTVSEFNARTLAAAAYFDPAADTVANVTLCATTTTNTDMRGTDSANTVTPDAAGVAPTAVEIRQEMDTNSADFSTIISGLADVPTVAEFNARTLTAASYALASALATAQTDLDTITGSDGVTLATAQALYAPNKVVPDAAGTAPTLTEIFTTQMTESYATNGTAPTLAQSQFAVHQMLMDFAIAGTSLTVKKLDSTTTAFIVTLNDATSPTGATR